MSITYTPLRYPGGKTKIYDEMRAILEQNNLIHTPYAEVFAGGAGLAVKLLLKGDVSSIIINDYDQAVFSIWDAIVNHSDEMCSFIRDVPINIDTWKKHHEIYRNRTGRSTLDLAKASFYLNRTNVSGILDGGIIGGQRQTGKFKMDARFNREALIRKIKAIAAYKNQILVTCLDAEIFIDKFLQTETIFAYLDPPYVKKGPGLYHSSFNERKHRSLANKIGDCKCKWVITYDSDTLIDEIYRNYQSTNLEVSYSANTKTVGKEKLILGPGLVWSK